LAPLVHLFLSFFKAHQANRKIPISLERDVLPDWLVTGAFLRLGYGLGSVKLNYPPPPGREGEMMEIDCSDMRSGDVVLSGSRSAYWDDDDDAPKKNMPRGYTSLEILTDRVWTLYFAELTRMVMTLQSWLHPLIRAGYENRRDVQFMQSERADYSLLCAHDGSGEQKVRGMGRTAAFVVNQPELWPGGPTYVGFFGMDGAATLAWACLLQERHRDLLVRPGFHMVELITAPIPARVPDLRWALDWKSELLMSVPPAEIQSANPTPDGPSRISSGPVNRDEIRA
jgi:hypothetical protein